MITNVFSGILEHLMNLGSSAFCGATLQSTFTSFLNFVFGLLYNVAKYMLYFVDLIFSYIQKLAGLDMSFDSLESMFSADSDIVFNLLISGADLVTTILRNLLVLAVFIIILFAIIAIIKGQIEALKKDEAGNPMIAIKRTFKAFILLLVTPFITLGGIAASDLILQSLYNATNVSSGFSLGTQIFVTSASSANAYRIYAQNDQKIPITFDGGESAKINEWFNKNSVNEGFVYYLQQSKENSSQGYNALYATYMTFYAQDFTTFSSLNTIIYNDTGTQATKDLYDSCYDYYYSDDVNALTSFSALAKIDAYAEEYYVMADVLDFLVSTGNTLYMKTIEEVLTSICKLPDGVNKETIFTNLVNKYGIEFYSSYSESSGQLSGVVTGVTASNFKTKLGDSIKLISFNSDYLAVTEEGGDPDTRMQINVVHVVGQTDELLGAKYIMASETSVNNSSGTPSTYYEPLVNGYKSSTSSTTFQSDYIRNGNIIVAKGIFKDSVYPTAIKQDKDGTLDFYREDIETQATGQMANYVSLTVESSSGGLFSKVIKFIKSLFDPSSLVPVIDVDLDAMQLTYDKNEAPTDVDTLVDGRLQLGYFMQYSPTYVTTKLASNLCLSFTGLYKASKLNFLILVIGSFLLLRVCMSAISSLIERSYELFLLFLTYPAACATIPIDDGGAYNTWLKGYFVRIFRTYGFILGVNFVLMLFPIIQKIEFFTQDEVGTSTIIHRVGILFFSAMSIREITNMLNAITVILFELTAFTLIETVPDMIAALVAGPESALRIKDNNVFTKIKNTSVKFATGVAKVVAPPLKVVGYVFSGKEKKKAARQKLKNQILNKTGLGAFSDMSSWKPGSAVKNEMVQKQQMKQAAQQQKKAEEELFKKLNDPSASTEEIKKALADFETSMQKANKATKPPKKIECPFCHQQNVVRSHFQQRKNENKDEEDKGDENEDKKPEKEDDNYYCVNDTSYSHPYRKSEIDNLFNKEQEQKDDGKGGGNGGDNGGDKK